MTEPHATDELADEWIDAVLEALGWPRTAAEILGEVDPSDAHPGDGSPEYWLSVHRETAAEVVAAVRPLIEAGARADERNRIADAIEAAALAHHAKDATYSEAYYDGMDDAATIARGDTP